MSAEHPVEKATVQNLPEFLEKLRGVLSAEDLAKAEAALAVPADSQKPNAPTDTPLSATEPVAPSQPGSLMRMLELGVTGLAAVAAALVLFTFVSARPKPAISFAMLDPNIAVAKYLETPGVADLDEQAFGTAVTKFHQALEVEMQRYSKETGRVLLSGAVVFAGEVPDVTTMLTDAALAKTPALPKPLPPTTPATSPSGANP